MVQYNLILSEDALSWLYKLAKQEHANILLKIIIVPLHEHMSRKILIKKYTKVIFLIFF